MSIVTKKGDDGSTGLMYNRRVSKRHAQVEAYGTVDELNAALDLARAAAGHEVLRQQLFGIQKDLVTVMGELATLPEDLPRYVKDGYEVVGPELHWGRFSEIGVSVQRASRARIHTERFQCSVKK